MSTCKKGSHSTLVKMLLEVEINTKWLLPTLTDLKTLQSRTCSACWILLRSKRKQKNLCKIINACKLVTYYGLHHWNIGCWWILIDIDGYWEILRDIERYLDIWRDIERCWEILRDIDTEIYWEILGDNEWYWEILRDIKRYWEILKDIERSWEILRDLERSWEILRGIERSCYVLTLFDICLHIDKFEYGDILILIY